MRNRLDCALLHFPDADHSCHADTVVHARGRLVLHTLPLHVQQPSDTSVLLSAQLVLKRFDACVLQVSPDNLAWARQTLAVAAPSLTTPVIGLLDGLTAPAIADLYHCGLADFLRRPLCHEALRVRIARLISRPTMTPSGSHYTGVDATPPKVAEAPLAGPYETGDHELEAFAIASAARSAHTDDSFALAKRKVVSRFEQAYLRASLAKSSGNITLAARRAKKHRRAYWALMKKHAIDAAPFRRGSS